ncbi:MAG: hypothetical protein L6244_05970, partial [Candidatus Methanoperedenaceae archaeon]|nr:hypothetical protein [Candidatus Methanoperedenaceae archaeon]
HSLQLNSYILSWSLIESDVPLNRFVFLDYGGGSGILSLLAKELNIGTVIYNDIYDVSCKDASIIGKSIGNQADYYIQGDIEDILFFLKTNSISCNAIASYDVIEHIYDIEGFFKKLDALSNGSLTVCMSSGANIFNPIIRRSLMRKQLEIEYKDREKKFGHKERDCLEAYFNIRKKIILNFTKRLDENLTEKEIEQLSRATRGMIESDIKKCVEGYIKTGHIHKEPSHPTNTCDPYTGNWAEHLMDIYYLRDILLTYGFRAKILGGYCGDTKNRFSNIYHRLLNLTIYMFKDQGIKIAPYFTIYGKREGRTKLNSSPKGNFTRT